MLLFVAVFNTMFFMIGGGDHNASVWISYGFIHLAYLILLITPWLGDYGEQRSTLQYPLISISLIYFIIELLVGVVLILIAAEKYIPTFLIQLALLAIFGFVFIPNLIANEATSTAVKERRIEIDFKKQALSQIGLILARVDYPETKKKVEKVFDNLNASPVKSHVALATVEAQILMKISSLEEAVETGDNTVIQNQAELLNSLITQRNAKLKTLQ